MREVAGKVAVITGAASGIGRGMAESFSDAGMKIVLSDIEKDELVKTTEALRGTGADVHSVVTDVSKPEQVQALADETLERFGAAHVLCNNAGIGVSSISTWDTTLDDWKWILDVNLMGVIYGIHTFMPIKLGQDSESHIVNTASMAGLVIGVMSLIGRLVGAGDKQRANQVISSGLILALGYSGVLAVLFLVFRFELIEVFATGDAVFAEIRELAGLMMFGLVTYMLADAVILIAGGTLRGAGDTRWVMLVSTGLHLLMLVAQVLVIRIWQMEALVAWWVFVVMLLCIAACYLARLLSGRWREPERLARVMEER